MSPEYVRPYVKAQKNERSLHQSDRPRPTPRFVTLKTEGQLDAQVLHRVRDRPVGQRPSLMNQIRSILLERGIAVPQGRRRLVDALTGLSSEPPGSGVTSRVRFPMDDTIDQWRALDARIKRLDDELAAMARTARPLAVWRQYRASA
jgi:transposase